jgi:hypothetical protein
MLQIAMKHYDFRVPGYSGKSIPPMTPKLHVEVSSKLQHIWGPYAGWAHSVLFTADLRAFATHQEKSVIPVPSVSPAPSTGKMDDANHTEARMRKRKLAGIPTSSPSPSRRKVRSMSTDQSGVHDSLSLRLTATIPTVVVNDLKLPNVIGGPEAGASLAERIKLRSRGRRIS